MMVRPRTTLRSGMESRDAHEFRKEELAGSVLRSGPFLPTIANQLRHPLCATKCCVVSHNPLNFRCVTTRDFVAIR
jgi:hypothetical protein